MRLLVVLLALGCSGETTVRLTIKPGSTQPRSLRLLLWGNGLLRPPADLPLGTHTLPGTVLLRGLSSSTPDFRVLVQGLDNAGVVGSEAGTHIPLSEGQENAVTVQLIDGRLADSDGDGIPDVVDDCPTVSDGDQHCVAPHPDGAVVDLAVPPLPDLAGADLAGADLRVPPDLAVHHDLSSGDMARGAACPSFAIFCDDFENGFGDWAAFHDEGGSSILDIVTDEALSGTHAAHAVGSGGIIYAPYIISPAVSSGMLAFRAYFFTPTTLVPHIYFFFLHRMGADSDYNLGWDDFGGPDQWTLYNKNPGTPTEFTASAAPGMWHCIEMDVTFIAGGGNKVEMYFDNAGPNVVNVPAAQAAPQLDELDIGVTYQTVSTGNQWYFDDVVLAKQHIGCE